MTLPEGVFTYLNDNAEKQGAKKPAAKDDLFKSGILDSFTLVDFVTMLEEQCGIQIPDGDVKRENFTTIEAIERYVEERTGASA